MLTLRGQRIVDIIAFRSPELCVHSTAGRIVRWRGGHAKLPPTERPEVGLEAREGLSRGQQAGVFAPHESTKTDGSRFRNTEVLTFEGDKIHRTEVYFGWDVE